MQQGVPLCFIRPGRPVESWFIESFNGHLRDECLNVEWFGSLHQARERLAQWRDHYSLRRPHSALNDQAPASFASSYEASEATNSQLQSGLVFGFRIEESMETKLKSIMMDGNLRD